MTDFRLTDFETVLTTTRAVRRRLDLERPVPESVLLECLELAIQAPTGGDAEDWRFVLVGDPELKQAVGAEYLRIFDTKIRPRLPQLYAGGSMRGPAPEDADPADAKRRRVYEAATYLAENIGRAPWLVLACATRPDDDPRIRAAIYGSVFPAIWSFQLALRSRGLGSVITTLHLREPETLSRLLGVPERVTQCALLPVAYTRGTDFRAARRKPMEDVVFRDRWGVPLHGVTENLDEVDEGAS